eukprot:TRINITY_DN41381_c0_g1_i1.p1 TRINITY_DN41381_c0_g1~~TRINITY_DN41381_c0_g1_i1.p1  ORF type:complete len:447 (-),score=87.52 TRINITY_DN41381_c0_g1_i1:105-1445(-)
MAALETAGAARANAVAPKRRAAAGSIASDPRRLDAGSVGTAPSPLQEPERRKKIDEVLASLKEPAASSASENGERPERPEEGYRLAPGRFVTHPARLGPWGRSGMGGGNSWTSAGVGGGNSWASAGQEDIANGERKCFVPSFHDSSPRSGSSSSRSSSSSSSSASAGPTPAERARTAQEKMGSLMQACERQRQQRALKVPFAGRCSNPFDASRTETLEFTNARGLGARGSISERSQTMFDDELELYESSEFKDEADDIDALHFRLDFGERIQELEKSFKASRGGSKSKEKASKKGGWGSEAEAVGTEGAASQEAASDKTALAGHRPPPGAIKRGEAAADMPARRQPADLKPQAEDGEGGAAKIVISPPAAAPGAGVRRNPFATRPRVGAAAASVQGATGPQAAGAGALASEAAGARTNPFAPKPRGAAEDGQKPTTDVTAQPSQQA